jgi:hypothetical protein
MDAAEDDPGAPLAREPPDFVAAKGVARVDADADDVPLGDLGHIQGFERFIEDVGIAPRRPGRRGENV